MTPPKPDQLTIAGITLDLIRKPIRNLHLRVYPTGRVSVSAPRRMSLEAIQQFVASKLGWIHKQQDRLRERVGATPRDLRDGETLYLWGQSYTLRVVEANAAPRVELGSGTLLLRVRPGADQPAREAVVAAWYRRFLKEAVPPLIAAWERRLSVRVTRFYVRQMRSRWGTCNPRARTIRLNTELVRRPPECLDYVVLHEMAHLIERTHNARFKAILDLHMPHWRVVRDALNRGPVGREG